jgi:hypothetical protein
MLIEMLIIAAVVSLGIIVAGKALVTARAISRRRFCHVSRRLRHVARPESSDYAICMMPIAMRACWRQ